MSGKVTMTDIARECGVSQTLVSFVISGKDHGISDATRKTVLETAARMGYKLPSRSGLRTVGIVCDREYTALSLSALLSGIYSVLSVSGYDMIFTGCTEELLGDDARVGQLGASGYIVITARRSVLTELSEHTLPFSFIRSVSRDADVCGKQAATEIIGIIEGRVAFPDRDAINDADIPGARSARNDSVWLL